MILLQTLSQFSAELDSHLPLTASGQRLSRFPTLLHFSHAYTSALISGVTYMLRTHLLTSCNRYFNLHIYPISAPSQTHFHSYFSYYSFVQLYTYILRTYIYGEYARRKTSLQHPFQLLQNVERLKGRKRKGDAQERYVLYLL